MKRRKYIKIKFLLALAILSMSLSAGASAQISKQKDGLNSKTTITGTIVTFTGSNPSFTLELKGMTSDADAKNDLNILKSEGQDGFLKAIEKQNLGYFSLEGRIGQELNYVTQTRTESGRKIVAVFGRWLQPFEVRFGTRSTDYPFTYIEMFFDNDGNGSGMIIGAARVQVDKRNPDQLEFENFGAFPGKLIGIEMKNKMQ